MSPNQLVRYDESKWPVLVVTLPEGELSATEMLDHVDRMSSFTYRGMPYVALIDMRLSTALGAHARRLAAERMDQDDETHPGVLLGVGIVLATSLHRGIFKAMTWLARRPRPFEAFTEFYDAMTWARRLSVPPARSMTLPIAKDVNAKDENKRVG